MLEKIVCFALAFTKLDVSISSYIQFGFVICATLTCIARILKSPILRKDTAIASGLLIGGIVVQSASLQSNFLFSIKNVLYCSLFPIFFSRYTFLKLKSLLWFLTGLSFATSVWHLWSPSNYITEIMNGSPRAVGFGVNPNVFAVCSILMAAFYKQICTSSALFSKSTNTCVYLGVHLLAIYLSGSQTAIACLPLMFLSSFLSISLFVSLSCSALVYLYLYSPPFIATNLPSLTARIENWKVHLGQLDFKNLYFGLGYDYFGAAIGSLAKGTVRVSDSFFVSSIVSGGIFFTSLLLYFAFLKPVLHSYRRNHIVMFRICAIFFVANLTGNFLENGFPANLLYYAMIFGILNQEETVASISVNENYQERSRI